MISKKRDIIKRICFYPVMKNTKSLLNGLLVFTVLFLAPSKVSSMPTQTEDEIKNAIKTADTRQAIQLGAMAGSMSSMCLLAIEGVIVPGEGPMTVDDLNEISTMLLTKARSGFDDTFIQYHKAGVNLGISECNKLLDEQLDYR